MSAPATTRGAHAGSPIGLLAAGIVGNTLSRKTRAYLGRGDSPRSGQPVWRNSYYEGQCEKRIWRSYGDGSKRTGRRLASIVVGAAKKFERNTRRTRQDEIVEIDGRALKARNRRRGLLGDVGVEVLEELWGLVDFMTGRLEPAIATIAKRIGRSYSAVHRALTDLRARGFLQWERRSREIEEPVPGGPLVEQIPNAYVLLIPPSLRAYVAVLFGTAPPADCVVWDAEQRHKAFDEMLSKMSAQEFLRATWDGDTRMGETLARIARLVDERESSIARETGGELHSP